MVTEPDLRICDGLRPELNLLRDASYCSATFSSICLVAQRSLRDGASVGWLVLLREGALAGASALVCLRSQTNENARMGSAREIKSFRFITTPILDVVTVEETLSVEQCRGTFCCRE